MLLYEPSTGQRAEQPGPRLPPAVRAPRLSDGGDGDCCRRGEVAAESDAETSRHEGGYG